MLFYCKKIDPITFTENRNVSKMQHSKTRNNFIKARERKDFKAVDEKPFNQVIKT